MEANDFVAFEKHRVWSFTLASGFFPVFHLCGSHFSLGNAAFHVDWVFSPFPDCTSFLIWGFSLESTKLTISSPGTFQGSLVLLQK